MNQQFKEWIIDRHENLPEQEKKAFLQLLKNCPYKVLNFIQIELINWATQFTFEKGIPVCSNTANGSQEILRALSEHFKDTQTSV
jgi:hypothetical protein